MVPSGFLARERFAVAHAGGEQPFSRAVLDDAEFRIDACLMDHGTPSTAYCVWEKPRSHVDTAILAQLGLSPGAWLKRVKAPTANPNEEIEIGGKTYRIGELRERILVSTPGESIAYLTDFRLDAESEERLVAMLQGCTTVVCENNFRNAEQELAQRTFHMVSEDVARLAARVKPQRLILFHLSDRYTHAEWKEQLDEVRAVFPETYFSESWNIDSLNEH